MDGELARAVGPRGEVFLRARADGAIELRVNGVFVMDTREVGTEQQLAGLALAQHPAPRRVLVGGLGLGFTARSVLDDPRVEALTVVEIEDAVVRWTREGLVPGGPELLADPRLEIVVADLRDFVAAAPRAGYEIALLDVDNGPDFLVHEGNAEIYRAPMLERIRGLLAPDGVLVVWSSTRSERLLASMEQAFGHSDAYPLTVDLQGRDEIYHLHVSRH